MRKLSAPMASYLLHIARYGQCPSLSGSALQTANAVETRGFLNRGLISVQLTPLGWSALVESGPVTAFELLGELHTLAIAMWDVESELSAQHAAGVSQATAGALSHISREHTWAGISERRSGLLNSTWVDEYADGTPYVTDAGYVAMGWPVSPYLVITPGQPTRMRIAVESEEDTAIDALRPDGRGYAAQADTEPIPASEMHDAAPVLDAWRTAEEAYLSQTVAVDAQGNPRSLADLNAAQKAGLISGPSPVPDTYVRHVDESHEMALIMETQRAYLAGELDHEEEDINALRPVFAPLVSDVDTAPMSVAQASLWAQDFSRDSGYGADYSGGPDVLAEMDREHQEWRDAETALAAESETAVYVPPADLRPYTAPRAEDSVYDAASGQHGTVHRVVSPNTVRVRWDRKHGRHLVAVSALLAEHAPCAFPGDQEHDHEMCHDAVLDAPTYQLGTYVVSDEDLWNGAEQTKSFLDSIRTQIRNSSTDDDAETFRPTGGCA